MVWMEQLCHVLSIQEHGAKAAVQGTIEFQLYIYIFLYTIGNKLHWLNQIQQVSVFSPDLRWKEALHKNPLTEAREVLILHISTAYTVRYSAMKWLIPAQVWSRIDVSPFALWTSQLLIRTQEDYLGSVVSLNRISHFNSGATLTGL